MTSWNGLHNHGKDDSGLFDLIQVWYRDSKTVQIKWISCQITCRYKHMYMNITLWIYVQYMNLIHNEKNEQNWCLIVSEFVSIRLHKHVIVFTQNTCGVNVNLQWRLILFEFEFQNEWLIWMTWTPPIWWRHGLVLFWIWFLLSVPPHVVSGCLVLPLLPQACSLRI